MILVYILKSSACLAVFMLFYKFFLERLNVHNIKRIYLLAIIALSFSIPLITFTQYVEVNPQTIEVTEFDTIKSNKTVGIFEKQSIDFMPHLLLGIYIIGAFFFLSRFSLNLIALIQRIKNNINRKTQYCIHVLHNEKITPHTFLWYIFFNKSDYDSGLISKEIHIHENAHAKELHSIDVLIIEVLQILLWFNPLIYLLRNDIRLNHEFIADRAVIKEGVSLSEYQNILLSVSTSDSSHTLANAFNFSSFKKRFLVMKTNTSRTSKLIRTFLILPITALLVYGFSSIEVQRIEHSNTTLSESPSTLDNQNNNTPSYDSFYNSIKNQDGASKAEIQEYNKLAKHYNDMPENNMVIKSEDMKRLSYLFNKMNESQQRQAEPYPDFPDPPPAPDAPSMNKAKHLIGDPPPPPPVPTPPLKKKSAKGETDIKNIPSPPPPPPKPQDPIDHIRAMADKGAIFYLEGKELSSDKAIDLIKNNSKINIQTREVNSKTPKVFLSKKPIYTDKKNN